MGYDIFMLQSVVGKSNGFEGKQLIVSINNKDNTSLQMEKRFT
jgi:hypothetical protein